MKLLAVSTSCWSAANREFYRRLNSDGYQVIIAIPAVWNFGNKTLPAEPKEIDDPALEFLQPTNFHHRLYLLNGLKQIIKNSKPDIIYFEGDPGSLQCAILGRIAKKNGIKLFALSCENLSQNPIAVIQREGVKQYFSALIKYSLIKYSKKFIDCLFVINQDGLSYFTKMGFKKVVKTPLGFNDFFFKIDNHKRIEVRKRLEIGKNNVVIAYFGRLVHQKGIHLLIDAMKSSDLTNCNLLIDKFSRYSNSYQKQVQQAILSSSLKNHTLFFEAEHLEIADYMNASDITILPSISTKKWVEQYGRVVPEAKACGNLLIISDEGAPKEFFEKDYPFIFKSGNVNHLKEIIEKAKTTIRNSRYDRKANSDQIIRDFSLDAQIGIFKSIANTAP